LLSQAFDVPAHSSRPMATATTLFGNPPPIAAPPSATTDPANPTSRSTSSGSAPTGTTNPHSASADLSRGSSSIRPLPLAEPNRPQAAADPHPFRPAQPVVQALSRSWSTVLPSSRRVPAACPPLPLPPCPCDGAPATAPKSTDHTFRHLTRRSTRANFPTPRFGRRQTAPAQRGCPSPKRRPAMSKHASTRRR
jgi:hypothetical protein